MSLPNTVICALLAVDAVRLQQRRGLRSSHTRDHGLGRLPVGSRCAGTGGELNIGLEFTWQRTQNIDALDRQNLAEERDHKSCFTVGHALRGGARARRQNDLRFHIRRDSQAVKHFLDVAAARTMLRIRNGLPKVARTSLLPRSRHKYRVRVAGTLHIGRRRHLPCPATAPLSLPTVRHGIRQAHRRPARSWQVRC